jgi:hypothetical protein
MGVFRRSSWSRLMRRLALSKDPGGVSDCGAAEHGRQRNASGSRAQASAHCTNAGRLQSAAAGRSSGLGMKS